jgi:hypothetical protein
MRPCAVNSSGLGLEPEEASHERRPRDDDLIWSVKPKATQEQRKALIGKLPRLLSTLNKWLDAIKWQDADRLQFFARLAECHASIVRAPADDLAGGRARVRPAPRARWPSMGWWGGRSE